MGCVPIFNNSETGDVSLVGRILNSSAVSKKVDIRSGLSINETATSAFSLNTHFMLLSNGYDLELPDASDVINLTLTDRPRATCAAVTKNNLSASRIKKPVPVTLSVSS